MTAKRSRKTGARRVGAYVRISKDREHELSTTVQREQIDAYAKARGWEIVKVYEDKGRSAFKRNVRRPAFEAMLDDVDAGVVDTVACYRLDRLTRSVADFANLWRRLEDAHAEFASVSEQFDSTTSMGRAMVNIAAVFAQLESDVKSERISDAMAQRRANGAPPHGPRAFGLTADRTAIVPDEARLVRQAARTVLAGGALKRIVATWNEKGILTATGAQWSHRGLRHVLLNPHTAGLRDVDGVLVEGTWPAVLKRDVYEQLVAMLRDPARHKGGGNGRVHLLTGFVTCSLCGTPMASKPHVAGPRYACAPRSGHNACQRQSVAIANVDGAVTDAVLGVLGESPAVAKAARNIGNGHVSSASIEDELAALAGDFGHGQISRAEWFAARDGLEARFREAQRAESAGEANRARRTVQAAKNPRAAWERLTVDQRRAVILSLIDGVTISPGRRTSGFDIKRIDIAWSA